MPNDSRLSRRSMDPHGYHPVVVDEDCLNDEDRRQAIAGAVAHPRSWQQYVTPEERQEVEDEIAEIERTKSPHVYSTRDPRDRSKRRQELAQRGTFLIYARELYADGLATWYGDGPPPWAR